MLDDFSDPGELYEAAETEEEPSIPLGRFKPFEEDDYLEQEDRYTDD